MKLRLVTQSMVKYEGDVDMILAPGEDGEMGILPNHMEMLATLGPGQVKVRKGSKEEAFHIKGGIISVGDDNKVDIMVG